MPRPMTATPPDVKILVAGAERLADVEPLWRALHQHHVAVAPELGADRSLDESWARRRRNYEAWFADSGAMLFLAEDPAGVIGYAMVRIIPGSETWSTPDELAELETFSVLPQARGMGIGRALVRAMCATLRARGIHQLSVSAIASNHEARRLYERWGLVATSMHYRGPLPALE